MVSVFPHPTVCRQTKQIIHNFTCNQSHHPDPPFTPTSILSMELLAFPALFQCPSVHSAVDSSQFRVDVNAVLLNNPRVVTGGNYGNPPSFSPFLRVLHHSALSLCSLCALSVLPPWERILSCKHWSDCSGIVQKEHPYRSLHQIILLLSCSKCLPVDYCDYLQPDDKEELTPVIIHLVTSGVQQKCRVRSWSWHHLTLGTIWEQEGPSLPTTGSWDCHQVNLGVLSTWK